jgi:hypothetical protein
LGTPTKVEDVGKLSNDLWRQVTSNTPNVDAAKDLITTLKGKTNKDFINNILIQAAKKSSKGHFEIIKFLFDNADPKPNVDAQKTSYDLTPLMFAAVSEEADSINVVDYLLKKGARRDITSSENRTALQMAEEIKKELEKKGKDTSIIDQKIIKLGGTVKKVKEPEIKLSRAEWLKQLEDAAYDLDEVKVANLLSIQNMSLTSDEWGRMIMRAAARSDSKDLTMINILTPARPTPHVEYVDRLGNNALFECIKSGGIASSDILNYIIKFHKPDLAKKTPISDLTALQLAESAKKWPHPPQNIERKIEILKEAFGVKEPEKVITEKPDISVVLATSDMSKVFYDSIEELIPKELTYKIYVAGKDPFGEDIKANVGIVIGDIEGARPDIYISAINSVEQFQIPIFIGISYRGEKEKGHEKSQWIEYLKGKNMEWLLVDGIFSLTAKSKSSGQIWKSSQDNIAQLNQIKDILVRAAARKK